jgi:hypothetical protein
MSHEGGQRVKIRFEDMTYKDQGVAAVELSNFLQRRLGEQAIAEHASLQVSRERSDTQDFGATLVIVLGTPAAIAIAKGIHDYISKRGSRVVIETEEGTVIATGDAAKNIDIEKTTAALRGV